MFETSGVVLDGDGNPLANATVGLYEIVSTDTPRPEVEAFQDVLADGSFSIRISTGAGVDHFLLVVACPGYHDDERPIHRDDYGTHRIVLSRFSDDVKSELPIIVDDTLMGDASVKSIPIVSNDG